MGPQHLSCGNNEITALMSGSQVQLQWGRSISAAEIGSDVDAQTAKDPLQWGRSISAAEIRSGSFDHSSGFAASMGPQHLSCGNPSPARRRPRHDLRFNGAAASQLRKSRRARCSNRRPWQASMGPQHLSCGNPAPAHQTQTATRRFNGAAASQLRKLRSSRHGAGRRPRFNGAAASQLRKLAFRSGRRCGRGWLQWGRSISAAEITPRRRRLSGRKSLQWGRSISAAEMVLMQTSDLPHVLAHDASTFLSTPNRFNIEQVAAPPSQNSYLQIMQLQSHERFRRFSQHWTARTMRQTTPPKPRAPDARLA